MKKLFLLLLVLVLLPMSLMAQDDWTEGYKGETNSKGEPHGKGVMVWKRNDGTLCRFDGYFSNGKPGDGSHLGSFFKKQRGKITQRETDFIYRSKKDKDKIFIMQPSGSGASFFADDDEDLDYICIGEVRNGNWHSGTQIYTLDYQARSFSGGTFGRLRTHTMDRSERMEFLKYLPQLYSNEEIKDILSKSYWKELSSDDYKDCVDKILKHSPAGTQSLDFQKVQPAEGYVIYNSKLVYLKKINWTREIKDGKISGYGEGIFQIGNVSCRVRGQYEDGVPRTVEYLLGDGEWEKKNDGYSYYNCLSPTEGLMAYCDKTDNCGFMSLDGRRSFGHYTKFKSRFSKGEAVVFARRNNFFEDIEKSDLYSQDVITAIKRKISEKYDYRTEFAYRVDTLGNFLGMTAGASLLPPTQKEYLKLCADLDAYKNKLKAANTNYKTFKINDYIAPTFIYTFSYPEYDPRGKVDLAKQIENEHFVIRALQKDLYERCELAMEIASKPSPIGMDPLHNIAKRLLPAKVKVYKEKVEQMLKQVNTLTAKNGIDANSSYEPNYKPIRWRKNHSNSNFQYGDVNYNVNVDGRIELYRYDFPATKRIVYSTIIDKLGYNFEVGKYDNETDAVAAGYYAAKYSLHRSTGEVSNASMQALRKKENDKEYEKEMEDLERRLKSNNDSQSVKDFWDDQIKHAQDFEVFPEFSNDPANDEFVKSILGE